MLTMATLSLKKSSTRLKESSTAEMRSKKDETAMNWLAGQYPDLFNLDAPKPLAVGLGKVIAAASPEGISRVTMRRVLERWTQTQGYLRAIAEGGFRYNLDATPAGAITDKHRRHALLLIEEKPCQN